MKYLLFITKMDHFFFWLNICLKIAQSLFDLKSNYNLQKQFLSFLFTFYILLRMTAFSSVYFLLYCKILIFAAFLDLNHCFELL